MVNILKGAAPSAVRAGRITSRDQATFLSKLLLCVALIAIGAVLAMTDAVAARIAGYLLLAAMFVHAVELQHQVLHHTAFVNQRPHRPVGVLLGLPMLVSYTHYRMRHLQHHKYLGTDRDTEFFQFDTRQDLTPLRLIRAMFHYGRWVKAARDCLRSYAGTWQPDFGQVPDKMVARIRAEYRVLGAVVVAVVGLSVATGSTAAVHLWLIPVLLAEPVHFLIELPEHIFCENETQDVLRNTRTITGSRFSTWFTNGNNLHVEHHTRMTVPMQGLAKMHPDMAPREQYLCGTYWDFYQTVLHRVFVR